MENNDQSGIRRPQPDAAEQDPRNAALQEQIHADGQASREEAARVRASTPADVRDKTVGEIVGQAEERADRTR